MFNLFISVSLFYLQDEKYEIKNVKYDEVIWIIQDSLRIRRLNVKHGGGGPEHPRKKPRKEVELS